MLKVLDTLLLSKKGKEISSLPYREDVVFLISGGLDSTIGVAQVIDKYNCVVYPLFVQRHSKNMKYEFSAIKKIYKLMKKKYPKNLKEVEMVDIEIPPIKFKKGLKKERLNTTGHVLRNVSLSSIGAQYAVFLNDNLGLDIKTVFLGSIGDDNFPHNKLEIFRLMTLILCWDLNDYRWQVVSPFIDPFFQEIPNNKKDNIKWAEKNGIPLNQTRTCTLAGDKACGICSDCLKRKNAFENAGFIDPADIK